jgi:hypothetical protein
MRSNQGIVDRVLRVGLGLLLVSFVFFGPRSGWLVVAGLVLMVTGLVGFCPAYGALGVHTRRDPR